MLPIRRCSLCPSMTGDDAENLCPECRRVLAMIQAAHRLAGDFRAPADPDPRPREERIRIYRMRAKKRLPLFGSHPRCRGFVSATCS